MAWSAVTRGRRALLEVLQRTKRVFVAARCCVHPATVSRWASGARTPPESSRRLLEELYGIDRASWTRRKVSPSPGAG